MREFEPWKPCRRIGRFAVRFVLLCMPLTAGAVEYTGGPAVAVRYFNGSGPNAHMGKGLADMVMTDIGILALNEGAPYKDCNLALVEWEKRAEIQKEIDLQQRPEFDPSTRVKPGQWIDPQYFIEGSVKSTDSSMSWSVQLRHIKSGRIVARDEGTVTENWIDASEGIAKRMVDKLCRKGRDYSGQPVAGSPPPPAAPKPAPEKPASDPSNDVMNAIKGLKGLFGK